MRERLKFTLKAWVVITVTTLALSWLTEAFFKYILGVELPEQGQVEIVRKLIEARAWKAIGLNLGLVLVAAPVVEEIIFRWVTRLGWRWPVAWGMISSVMATMFTAAHYYMSGTHFPDNAFVALFAFGLMQAWLYKHTKWLWCSMLTHALFNTTNIVLLVIMLICGLDR